MKTLLCFIVMRIFVFFTSRWIWNYAYISAGKTKREVWEYRGNFSSQKRFGKYVYNWLIRNSPKPGKTRALIFICSFESIISTFGILFAFYGLYTSSLGRILFWVELIIGLIIIINIAGKCVYDKKYNAYADDSKYKNSGIIEDVKTLLSISKSKEREEYGLEISLRRRILGGITLILIVLLMVGTVFLIVKLTNPVKTPAEASAVEQVLLARDFTVVDRTSETREKWGGGDEIEKVIISQKDDAVFGYYVFSSEDIANNVGSQFISSDREKCGDAGTSEKKDIAGNYGIFTMSTDTKYVVVMRVDGTLVRACCDKERSEVIKDIMRDIGYFKTVK